jgi:hypothetical protein
MSGRKSNSFALHGTIGTTIPSVIAALVTYAYANALATLSKSHASFPTTTSHVPASRVRNISLARARNVFNPSVDIPFVAAADTANVVVFLAFSTASLFLARVRFNAPSRARARVATVDATLVVAVVRRSRVRISPAR